LPQTLVIPRVMNLSTLADVRTLIRHVPAERREMTTWLYVASQLGERRLVRSTPLKSPWRCAWC
jgi:hypothetical protein